MIAAALSAPTSIPTNAAPTPTAIASIDPPQRQPVDRAFGECNCRLVNKSELYYNRYQGSVIHRVCGCPWSGPRMAPVRIGPTEPSRQPLAVSA